MTARPVLLAELVEERYPAVAIEAERCDLRRPGDVRLGAVRRPTGPPPDTDLDIARHRRGLVAADHAAPTRPTSNRRAS